MYVILHIPTGLFYTCRFDNISIFTPNSCSNMDTLILAEKELKKIVKDEKISITFEEHVIRFLFETIDVSPNEFEIMEMKQ